jgi:hypothetical protein
MVDHVPMSAAARNRNAALPTFMLLGCAALFVAN